MRIETFLCRSFDDKEHDVYVWDESTRQEQKDQTLPFKLPGWIVAETLDYLREQVIYNLFYKTKIDVLKFLLLSNYTQPQIP
jgi:hypothetical protein